MSVPLTVILPVHNGAAYLREALASVLGQTFGDFELIVIDDCSTDESPFIAESFGDARLRLIRSSQRLRISNALNLGIENARGQLIARMDSDDVCHPRRFQRQIDFLNRHKQIGFCGTWVRRFGEGLAPSVYRRPVGPERVRAFSLFDNPIVHSSVMIRREALARLDVCYRDDFVDAEDYDLWTRLFEVSAGDNLPEVLLNYRVHAGSVTVRKTESMMATACRILKRELIRAGMNVSDEEVLQHRQWATGCLDVERDSKSLERAEAWLKRLLEANHRSQLFESAALRWAAREIWFALCYRALDAGKPVLRQFAFSPISRTDFKHALILLGAMVKRAR